MRVALTGTPGTGKTSVASRLADSYEVVALGEVIDDADLARERDEVRRTEIVDMDGLRAATADIEDAIFESHLSHHLPVDIVIVLRCAPETLERRLRDRGVIERSVQENAESEALDLILAEAVEEHGAESVFEIDTTDLTLDEVAAEVKAAIDGELDPRVGIVDFTGYL